MLAVGLQVKQEIPSEPGFGTTQSALSIFLLWVPTAGAKPRVAAKVPFCPIGGPAAIDVMMKAEATSCN